MGSLFYVLKGAEERPTLHVYHLYCFETCAYVTGKSGNWLASPYQ